MKKGSFFLLFLFFTCHLNAQYLISDKWYDGEVIFNNQQLLKGQVKLDLSRNLLHYKVDTASFIFLPAEVNHFKIYSKSAESDLPRIFSPINYPSGNRKGKPAYFELLFIGKTTSLLAKGRAIPNPPGPLPSSGWTTDIEYDLFLQLPGGIIKKFLPLNSSIINLLKDEKGRIRSFIKSNSLNCVKFDDLVRVVEYYDGLKTL